MMEIKSVTTGGGPVKEMELIKQNLNIKQQSVIDEDENVQQKLNEHENINYNDINGDRVLINNIKSDNELVLVDEKIDGHSDIIETTINTEINPSHINTSNKNNLNNKINNNNNNSSNNNNNINNNYNNMCNTEINNKISSPSAGLIQIRKIEIQTSCSNGEENENMNKNVEVDQENSGYLSPVGGTSKLTKNFLSPNCNETTEEIDEINRFFETHPGALERWIKEKASSDILTRIHATVEPVKSPRTPKRASVTSDLFQLWLTSSSPVKKLSTTKAISRLYTAGQGLNSPIFGLLRCRSPTARSTIGCRRHLENLDEGELFMELIRDVANELDIDVLCHKILVNVGLLTHADRGSLFLAKGPPNNRYLVAKLFDVTQNTALDDAVRRAKAEEIIIPFGVGIAGSVAQTKETINIKEAYTDPRFNCEIDIKTGYKTHVILSMPICNYEGDVIGVAQIINKTNDSGEFTERDVEVFRRYLTFCGIGIQNAQLFEMSVQEYRRNQILLNLARSIFEEQNNLECLVTKIMTEARELLKCERCSVYLLDLDCCEASHLERVVEKPSQPQQLLSRRQSHNVNVEDILEQQKCRANFAILFELGAENQSANVFRPSVDDLGKSTLAQIAQYVASTGQNLNIADVAEWLKDKPDIRRDDETSSSKTILCMPIVNGQKKVIGVAQLINKENSLQFTESDISIFEAFAIFCGLGIHNTQMYENACKLMAKQKVALECLSYHATAAPDQTVKLIQDTILPAESFNLYSFTFIDFDLSDDDTCRATVRMFLQLNLVQQFHVPYDVLCRWILSVRKNYRPVKYHNWRHALNVAQTMFAMLKTGKMERFMTDLQILGLLVACLCHDLDHRGTNNAFQTKSDSPLAILYTTSTMEHHHFDQCVMILNSEGNNIFQALSPDDYRNVMKVVETAILSTDLAMYFKKRNSFLDLIDNGEFDWQSEEKKELLCGMMMTACDVSAIAKPWEVQHRVAKMVADEFFDQGDLEKSQLNTQPIAMMDRERKDELPKMQVGFIDVICLPLYRVLSETFPWIRPLYEGTVDNRQHWQDLAEKVEMGLTWIDHDTIDKPVEEFSACSEEIKDIEFTVQTLNCTHPEQSDVTTPEKHRNKLSLRKPSALSKAVRAKLNKSLYNNSTVMQQHQQLQQQHNQQQQQQQQQQEKEKQIVTPSTDDGTQDFSENNTQVCSNTATTSAAGVHLLKNEKHKRKSKLCLLL